MTFRLTLSVFVFTIGTAQALSAIWVMLGLAPAILPAVDRREALFLYVLLSIHVILAMTVIMAAQTITTSKWVQIRPGMTGQPEDIKFLDGFFMGGGLVMLLTAVVTPPLIIALVVVSPWMGLVAVAATGAMVKGFRGWTNAVLVLKGVKIKDTRCRFPRGLFSAVIATGVSVAVGPLTLDEVERGIDRAVAVQMRLRGIAQLDLDRVSHLIPELSGISSARVASEAELAAQEAAAVSKGVSSPSASTGAKIKVMEATTSRMVSLNNLADAASKLRREIEEIDNRITGLRSAAPAIHR